MSGGDLSFTDSHDPTGKGLDMRVLFVSALGTGHVFPIVPLAWALQAAGHDVLVAAGGDALAVERAGLHVVDVLPGQNMRGIFEWIREHRTDLLERLGNADATRDLREAVPVFAQVADRMADGIVRVAEEYRPDVVVYSQLQGAGPLAAAKLGIPAVQQGFGFARTAGVDELFRVHLSDAYQRHGVTELPRITKIDVAPPSMLDEAPEGWSIRYVPYNGGGVLPRWLTERPERPRVAVTLGTVAPTMNGLGSMRWLVESAARVDADFMLTLAEADLDLLGELPPNVRPVGWVPLRPLLRTCTAVVHHGGAGTALTALDAALPQLVLPDGADRYANADAVHARGLGLSTMHEEVDVELLNRLLGDDKLRAAASEVRAEMHAMPTPASLVGSLTELPAS